MSALKTLETLIGEQLDQLGYSQGDRMAADEYTTALEAVRELYAAADDVLTYTSEQPEHGSYEPPSISVAERRRLQAAVRAFE